MSSRPSNSRWRATALLALACAATGLLALYYGTAGFHVVSTEAGRRLAIEQAAAPLPPAIVRRAADGRVLPLAADLAADGRPAIVTFGYTRCRAICSAAGSELQQLQGTIVARGLAGRVRLVTITFDPADDDAALNAYAGGLRADPAIWRFYGIADPQERQRLLDTFGVVVVPAPPDFVHNAAYHIVDPDGRLRRIVDIGEAERALESALRLGAGA